MISVPSPAEILQRIIDEGGSCDWTVDEHDKTQVHYICDSCPIGQLYRNSSCCGTVARVTRNTSPMDAEYKQVAIQLLEDIEVDKMLDNGDESENR